MWPGFVHLGPKPLGAFLCRSINSSDQPPQSLQGKKKWQTLTRRKGLEALVVFGIVFSFFFFFGNEEEINILKPHDVGVEFPRIWDGLSCLGKRIKFMPLFKFQSIFYVSGMSFDVQNI